jgi:hypothetical protein
MSQRKPLIRRTFLQERYEILIKRQQSGKATFNELTELDDIVNRDPSIREIVLIENHFIDNPDDDNEPTIDPIKNIIKPAQHQNWLSRIRSYIGRIFILPVSATGEKALLTL